MSNKTQKILTSVLLFIFIFSNLMLLPLKSLAVDPPAPGNPDFTGPVLPSKPGDPGFIGPSQPKGILAAISGGLCGTIDSIKDAILGKAIDKAENTASGLIDSGLSTFGLSGSSGGLGGGVFGGITGGSEVPVNDKTVRDNTQQIKKDTNTLKKKETCQDTIIVPIAKYFLRQMTKDLVNWIKKGFNGQPRFIQNFGDFLNDAGDRAGGILLEQILGKGNAEKLCEPWKVNLALKILGPPKRKMGGEPQCKISEIIDAAEKAGVNIDVGVERQKRQTRNFINNFSQGGWPAFLTSAFDDNSNYPGYALTLMDKKERLKAEATKAAEVEAVSSNGILAGICMEKETLTLDAHGEKNKGKNVCKRSKILTPGAAIVGALPDSLQADMKQLEVADEINEIVFALADAMTHKKFWEGLVGSDERDSEGGVFNNEAGAPHRGFNGIEQTDESGNLILDEDGNQMPGTNINDFELTTQSPSPLKPKNNEIKEKPIEFDFTDANFLLETIKNYQIFITFPDGREKTINTKTATNPNDTPPSKYQMTNEEFQEFDIGGTYFWRVAAINNNNEIINGASGISEENSFEIPMSTILSPIKHSVISSGPITFKWSSINLEGVSGYKLELTNLTLPDEPPILKNIEETQYIQTQEEFNAMKGGRYFIKITAVDAEGAQIGAENHIRFFLITAPKLTAPQNNENISSAALSNGITFDWENIPLSVNKIVNYEIKIKKEDGGFLQSKETTSSEFTISDLEQNKTGKYFWKVRAIVHKETVNDAGDTITQDTTSAWSDDRIFELTE